MSSPPLTLDDPAQFEQYGTRQAGHYLSRCTIPADTLNEGRYVLAVNASAFRVKRYFWDDHALAFTVDATGAPGKHWPEPRLGPVRPALDWKIERLMKLISKQDLKEYPGTNPPDR